MHDQHPKPIEILTLLMIEHLGPKRAYRKHIFETLGAYTKLGTAQQLHTILRRLEINGFAQKISQSVQAAGRGRPRVVYILTEKGMARNKTFWIFFKRVK